MVYRRYDDLRVYQLAFERAVEIHKLSLEWPKIEQFGGLADQIRRSSKSICANIAEGMSKGGAVGEERRFLSIAMGSCEETRVWLDFALRLGYLPQQKTELLRTDYEGIAKVLNTLLKKRMT